MSRFTRAACLFLVLALAACGGGSGGSGGGTIGAAGWTAGVYQSAASFSARCAMPRTGSDPVTGKAYPDRAGSVLYENNWLRSWSNDLYLWYSEILDQDPGTFSTAAAYFKVLKTTAATASGAAKDKFHFTYDTAKWEALSSTGTSAGYGPQWELVQGTPPRDVRIAWMEGNVPADATESSLGRGAQLLAVDGVDMVNGSDTATLNAGLFPAKAGEHHAFTVTGPGALGQRTVPLVSEDIAPASVRAVQSFVQPGGGTVGYMQFNDHLAASEGQLRTAFTTLANAGVTDLVLDIRYNGGGYLDIASEVAYMIAGGARTAGKTFELTKFNSKHPTVDPVAGGTISPTPFLAATQGFSSGLASGQALPTLDLGRVFVLTGSGTCSASEAIVNSLRGIGVDVIQVGSTTCGKPYGFYPQDNCGTTYFSIEFQGVNATGFGNYPDGFTPQNSGLAVDPGAQLPGCSVADDFSHQLGDPAEGRFAAALAYRVDGICHVPASGIAPRQLQQLRPQDGSELSRPAVREIRLLR
jgi:C-terminal processing protease CtpA/Prc